MKEEELGDEARELRQQLQSEQQARDNAMGREAGWPQAATTVLKSVARAFFFLFLFSLPPLKGNIGKCNRDYIHEVVRFKCCFLVLGWGVGQKERGVLSFFLSFFLSFLVKGLFGKQTRFVSIRLVLHLPGLQPTPPRFFAARWSWSRSCARSGGGASTWRRR